MTSMINLNTAHVEFGVPRRQLAALIETAALTPVASTPHGRGTMHFWPREAVEALAKQWHEDQEKAKQPPAPAVAAPDLAGIEARLDLLVKTLNSRDQHQVALASDLCRGAYNSLIKKLDGVHPVLSKDLANITSDQLTLSKQVQTLAQQVSPQLSTLGAQVALIREQLQQLATVVENISAVVMVPPSINVVKPATLGVLPGALAAFNPGQSKLPRVVVVGGNTAQHGALAQEFSDMLDLRMVEGVDAKGRSFEAIVTSADHVVLMTKFISHNSQEVVKNHKIPHTLHPGSVSSLHDVLTRLAVELTEAKKKAA